MATIHQIDSNRRNALKSGIDAQSQIIRGERLADLDALIAEYLDRFQPATPEERLYVDTLIRDDWQLRRFAKVDAQLWEYEMISTFKIDQDFPIGHAFQRAGRYFERLQRRINATERSYQRSLHELERLQSTRDRDGQPAAQPTRLPNPQPAENDSADPQFGFVPPPSLAASSTPARNLRIVRARRVNSSGADLEPTAIGRSA